MIMYYIIAIPSDMTKKSKRITQMSIITINFEYIKIARYIADISQNSNHTSFATRFVYIFYEQMLAWSGADFDQHRAERNSLSENLSPHLGLYHLSLTSYLLNSTSANHVMGCCSQHSIVYQPIEQLMKAHFT